MTDGTHSDLVLMPGEWSPGEAARYVTDAYTKSVEAVIETGRRLVEAKQSLPHGQWLPMVELLPFSERTARAFMQIAEHAALSNRQHVADLPASWGTLAVLAQLPPDEVEGRIQAGEITPDLQRSQAEQWASVHQFAKAERYKNWTIITDSILSALSALQTFGEPPPDLPASRTQPAQLRAWLADINRIVEAWND